MAISKEQAQNLAKVANVNLDNGGVTGKAAAKALDKLTNLTPNIFITDFLDTLNFEENPFDVFIKRDVEYGNGVRYVSTGTIASQQYKIGNYTPDLMGSKVAPDYEDFSTSLIQSTYPLIYNEPQMSFYFKNYENLATFMNQVRATNDLSYKNERLNMFLYIFGNNAVDLPQYIKTELDKTTAKIVNVQDLGTKADMKEVFADIVKLANKMGGKGIQASKDFNIGFAKGSVDAGRKLNKSNPSTDLVLILPVNDMIDLSTETATIYHQSFYQGDNKFYKVIEADIPSGTGFLVDKETIRLQPKLNATTSQQWMDLSVTVTSNIWTFVGIFKYGNGVKFTYSKTKTIAAKQATAKQEDVEQK